VAPSPPAPSHRVAATDALPTPSPRFDPTPSPEASPSPSEPAAAECGTTPPTGKDRITVIDLPPKAYLGVRFAGCSVWVGNNENGKGIHHAAVASNKVVGTILKGPIETPVTLLRSDPGELWALRWADPAQIIRIDPVTGKSNVALEIETPELGGGIWIMDGQAWVGPSQYRASPNQVRVIDLDMGTVTATFDDLVPFDMWRDDSAIWALASPRAGDTDGGDLDIVRIDPSTFEVHRQRMSQGAFTWGVQTRHHGDLVTWEPGRIVMYSPETGLPTHKIPIPGSNGLGKVVSTGTELWALPVESMPLSKGCDNRSRQLLQIDPESSSIVRRIPIRENCAMDLFYGYGSLWILAPDNDYQGSFGMHLVRVELPAHS
jgi:hypothetical protein